MQQSDLDLVERFLAAYNALDSWLQAKLKFQGHGSFRSAVDLYAKRNRWWKDADALRVFAGLRNILVHERVQAYEYLCVPAAATVAEIEAIRDRLLHPETALPRFERAVRVVSPNDSVAAALAIIQELGASQLPVYSEAAEERRFHGVLTENNLTRWLARCAQNQRALNFHQYRVSEVLQQGGKRINHHFVACDTTIEEIVYLFHENTFLEVVLVTRHGHENEALRGVVSRGDVWRYESRAGA